MHKSTRPVCLRTLVWFRYILYTMKLLEYEAKTLLCVSDIPAPHGVVVSDKGGLRQITAPVVVKSQVPTGGRGKLGGVRVVKDGARLAKVVEEIFALEIKGFRPRTLLLEELVDIDREFYLSLVINREKSCIELLASGAGGVEIEDQDAESFLRREIEPDKFENLGELLAEQYNLPEQSFALQDLLEKLYHCFVDNDATLLEINPLILTRQGALIAGDCKMTLDDAAAFRHPDWDFEDKPADNNFVTLDPNGTVATIANGAGLAMATMDAVKSAGFAPANFLDIGGAATVDTILKSFDRIAEFPHVNAIVINIFGGIVRCDTVAQAIVDARAVTKSLPPLYIRLSGNRAEEASRLLEAEGLVLYPTLKECIGGIER